MHLGLSTVIDVVVTIYLYFLGPILAHPYNAIYWCTMSTSEELKNETNYIKQEKLRIITMRRDERSPSHTTKACPTVTVDTECRYISPYNATCHSKKNMTHSREAQRKLNMLKKSWNSLTGWTATRNETNVYTLFSLKKDKCFMHLGVFTIFWTKETG